MVTSSAGEKGSPSLKKSPPFSWKIPLSEQNWGSVTMEDGRKWLLGGQLLKKRGHNEDGELDRWARSQRALEGAARSQDFILRITNNHCRV